MTDSFTIRKLALAAALAGSVCVTVHAQAPGSEQIFAELTGRNQTRAGGRLEHTAGRVYRVSAPGGRIHAASCALRHEDYAVRASRWKRNQGGKA